MDTDAAALIAALSNLDRVTDDAQADAVALVQALVNDDQIAVVQAVVDMTDAERLLCVLALAAALASCSEAFGIAPADLIRKAET